MHGYPPLPHRCREGLARSSRHPHRPGQVSLAVGLALVFVTVIGGLVAGMMFLAGANISQGKVTLTLYCAAGLRPVVETVIREYEREYGAAIQVQYGGSNTLLSQIEAAKVGDLFIAAEETYIQLAIQRKIAREAIPIATQQPVIAVRKGNPLGIHRLDDLLKPGVRVALANPDQAAIGKVVRALLRKSGRWSDLEQKVRESGVFKPTVNDLANDLKLGSVDASILWDPLISQDPELEAVPSPELHDGRAEITICILSESQNPTQALHFARFISSRDRGAPLFRQKGYEPLDGDEWAKRPELTFFVGAVNRRAVEETIKTFEQREGAVVNAVYNGCGILNAQIQAIRDKDSKGFPDAYMACDVYYLEKVKDWFQDAVNISETDIVIVVPQGNPKSIQRLEDLAKPGIRLVVGQPEQCTIGALTRRMLDAEGLGAKVMKNVVSQAPTSAMLVPAVTTGAADAALAYATDARTEAGRIETVSIASTYTKAVQPFAIARSSRHKQLARRLFLAIAHSEPQFSAAGFCFKCANFGHERLSDPVGSTDKTAPANQPP